VLRSRQRVNLTVEISIEEKKMKGDFSRVTFDSSKHFSRVLMQQGRVQLDSEWNEQSAIVQHFLRTLAADLIGPFGGTGQSFEIFTKAKDPDEETLLREASLLPGSGDFLIRGGHYYVDGLLCENEGYVLYSKQTEMPTTPPLKVDGAYLAYIDVWERHLTYLEDDTIREVALGGPDTATRTKIVWQIKVHAVGNDDFNNPLNPTKTEINNISKQWTDWVKRFAPPNRGRLKATINKPKVANSTNPCNIAPDARYRGAENQLYRVEVHQSGTAGGTPEKPTFKWSRENGSIVFPIVELNGNVVTLAQLGRDEKLGLKANDFVEIATLDADLSDEVFPLVQIDAIDYVELTVRFRIPEKANMSFVVGKDPRTLFLRRWDHQGDLNNDGGISVTVSENDCYTLEDGIQIQFQKEGATYRRGDYWLIPARTATGDIEWPKDGDVKPHGIDHHYAPLAVLSLKSGTLAVVTNGDCRRIITAIAS
jgi:hypothetical protein